MEELEHRSHLIEVCPTDANEIPLLPAPAEVDARAKPARIEKEHHKQAFAYYYSLGKDRTLAKVAEAFEVKESLVLNWSSTFEWKKRIAELENRSQEEQFKEKAMGHLILLLDSMVRWDDETGRLVLTSSEKVAAEKLKLCIDAFKKLRDDSREGGPKPGSEDDAWPRKPRPCSMVRVKIIGLSPSHPIPAGQNEKK